jgi:hypothetical protein
VGGEPCTDCDPVPAPGRVSANLIDHTAYFVANNYLDFLGRGPDTTGLRFWENEVESCGTNLECREVKRVNVSAAFFLSIEFQETGYLVYRLGMAPDGVARRYTEFMGDTRQVGAGVQVGREGWQGVLEANRLHEWAQRQGFRAKYDGLDDEQFVAVLLANAGMMSDPGRDAVLVSGLRGWTLTRSAVLLKVADDEGLRRKEFNRAFILMQHYGYLRRDPDAEGYQYWLSKLESFKGNFVSAEMVKAFLDSDEYHQRFGQ